MLTDIQVIDLSAVLSPATIMWPGDAPMIPTVIDELDRDGSFSRRVTLGEHSGTHFDAPAHFAADGATVESVPADNLVRPLRIVDISDRADGDPDALLTVNDVETYERQHGLIEPGSAVFLHTGWDTRSSNRERYTGWDDELHFPGFGVEAASLLVDERQVSGVGIDTLSIDGGRFGELPVHRDVTLPRGVWQVENAVNLGVPPPSGAWVVVGVPRISGASGFPARVLALVPRRDEGPPP